MTTIAEQMIRRHRDVGVTRVHGVVGDSLKSIVDAVRRIDSIN